MAIDPAIAVTSELSGAERSAQRTARLRCRPHGRTAALGPRGVASRAPRAPVGRAARTPRCRRRNGASGGRRAGHSGGAGVQQVSPSRPRGAPRSAATSVARPPPGGATQRPTAAPARGPRAPPRAALRRRRGSAGRRLGAGRCPTRRAPLRHGPPARPRNFVGGAPRTSVVHTKAGRSPPGSHILSRAPGASGRLPPPRQRRRRRLKCLIKA